MSNPFKPKLSIKKIHDEDTLRKKYYQGWKGFNMRNRAPFIAIDNSFKEKYLHKLEAGPLRLYLYFSFAANNTSGHSWHSVETIADYFGAQTRTIDNWIKVLVDEGLIYRKRAGKKSNTTYLIPFNHTILKYNRTQTKYGDEQKLLDECLTFLEDMKHIYGDVVRVYHFFQWSDEKHEMTSYQDLFVLCKRNDVVTIINVALKNVDEFVVSEDKIDEILCFESPFKFKDEHIIGLAYPDTPIYMKGKSLPQLVETLAEFADMESWEFDEILKVKYDHVDVLFPPTESDETQDVEKE